MAFNGDDEHFHWAPYSLAYGNSPLDEFGESDYSHTDRSFKSLLDFDYSSYNSSEPKSQYDPYDYGFFINQHQVGYSDARYLQYEPPVSDRSYHFPAETIFRISYSESPQQFNEPEFEEYDPTPYGGGYDIAATYGKPIPPSDLICYPRSQPQSGGFPPENFSYNSVPPPYGKREDDDLPKAGDKSIGAEPVAEAPVAGKAAGVDSADVISSGDDSCRNGFENGIGYERQIDRIPYGAGLESIDLCESIFGHWPCLAKIEQQQQQRAKCLEDYDRERRMDPWKSAADYLFGAPAMYGYGSYHHLQQEGAENPWL
ncbi:uncharacterized protein LOC127247581 [Andrographis paniculata]|uniref:uncharacterized protein LOC127247581 n=1 Tax=Andrographis paniculata TaxID=175694 RepID=UPI0021E9842A|nr:uncharacterized protein LOC127247581 [Andrographis paniculata]